MDAAELERRFDFQNSDHGRSGGRSLAWRLRRPIVPAAKTGFRLIGKATARWRPLPDFLVIGAKRGGSTSLYRNLVAGSGFAPLFPRLEQLKGTYYFDARHHEGERWYRSHLPIRTGSAPLVGEASPYYLCHPLAAERAAALVPDAKIIAILRDPVARAHSHYRERVAQGIEILPTFADALAAEDGRLEGELERMVADPSYRSWNHLNFGYVDQSRYHTALQRWFDHFDRDQILVLSSEAFFAEPERTLNRCRAFLGVPPESALDLSHHNRLDADPVDAAATHFVWQRVQYDIDRLESELDMSFGWTAAARRQAGVS